MKMKARVSFLCGVALAAGVLLSFLLARSGHPEFKLAPLPAAAQPEGFGGVAGTEVGTGVGLDNDPQTAAGRALAMALRNATQKPPHFAIVYVTSGGDTKSVLHAMRQMLGPTTKIFGGTSDSRGVMTDKGYVAVSKKGYEAAEGSTGVAIMTISSNDMTFGLGFANLCDFPSPQEMAKAAVLEALKSAGKSPEELPRALLLCSTIGIEEEVLEGIEQVVGSTVPVLGGTAGGPVLGVLGDDEVYERGACVAVLYTDLPVGWTFEAGFDVTQKYTGIVTKVEGQAIVEIDHRPALDVYNEWVDGEIDRLHQNVGEPGAIRDLLTLHPLYRRYQSRAGQDYLLFSHPWPKDDRMQDRSIMTSTKIQVGEEVCLSSGTWGTLLNRIGNLPTDAKAKGRIGIGTRPLLALGFICGGVLGVIPETERHKMSFLMNYTNSNGPFIANFTWGEQGHFPGIGNKHGNLSTSFLVIGPGGTSP